MAQDVRIIMMMMMTTGALAVGWPLSPGFPTKSTKGAPPATFALPGLLGVAGLPTRSDPSIPTPNMSELPAPATRPPTSAAQTCSDRCLALPQACPLSTRRPAHRALRRCFS